MAKKINIQMICRSFAWLNVEDVSVKNTISCYLLQADEEEMKLEINVLKKVSTVRSHYSDASYSNRPAYIDTAITVQ